MNWEYQAVRVYPHEDVNERMAELAERGWEIFAVTEIPDARVDNLNYSRGSTTFYARRPSKAHTEAQELDRNARVIQRLADLGNF